MALDGLPASLTTTPLSADSGTLCPDGGGWAELAQPWASFEPSEACLGAKISQAQHAMLERIEELVSYFLKAAPAPFSELGRSAEKLGNLCKVSLRLGRHDPCSHQDSFLDEISSSIDPYAKPGRSTQKHSTPSTCHEQPVKTEDFSSSAEEVQADRVPLATTITKEVVAERIKWKLGPTFNPEAFLLDPIVKQAFRNPEILRLPQSEWPRRAKARVHCSRTELLALAAKWDKLGSCRLVETQEIDSHEAVGLFAVSKDEDFDRLIINPTVINSRQMSYSNYTRTLAPGSLICLLRLDDSESLVISTDDLSEYYYTFQASDARSRRNAVGSPFASHEVEHLDCYHSGLAGKQLYIALGILAMGDGLAVGTLQCRPDPWELHET